MRLRIQGFRCHIDSDFTFNESLILIKGEIGSGKSTIFQALYWCLYGTVRKIYTKPNPTKCVVSVELSDICVIRQGKPKLLKVIHKGEEYEDNPAQHIIDKYFGTADTWLTGSLIFQELRCNLLYGTQQERLSLLNKISFHLDDPKECIEKIQNKSKELTDKFNIKQSIYTEKCNVLSEELKLHPLTKDMILSLEEIEALKINKEELLKLEKVYFNEILKMERLQGELLLLKNNKDDLDTKLKNMNKPLEEELIDIHRNISRLNKNKNKLKEIEKEHDEYIQTLSQISNEETYVEKEIFGLKEEQQELKAQKKEKELMYSNLQKNIEQLTNELKEIKISGGNVRTKMKQYEEVFNDSIEDWKEINLEDMNDTFNKKIILLQNEYENSKRICEELNISYLGEEIEHKKNELDKLECTYNKYKECLINYEKRKILLNKLYNNLSLQQLYEKKKQIENTQKEEMDIYNNMKIASSLLICPHCNGTLKYDNHKLIKGNLDLIDTKELPIKKKCIDELQKTYDEIIHDIKIQENIKDLICEYDQNDIPSNLEELVNINKKEYDKLRYIKIITKPSMTSESIIKLIKYKKKISKLSKLKETYNRIEPRRKQLIEELETIKVDEYESLINNVQNKINSFDINKIKDKYKEINIQFENFKKTRKIDEKVEDIEEEIENLKHNLDQKSREYDNYVNALNQLKEINAKIDNIQIDINIKDKYEEVKKNINNVDRKIEDGLYSQEIIGKRNQLSEEKNKIEIIYNDMINVETLLNEAIKLEYDQLEQCITYINTAMEEALNYMFNEPIVVKLSLHKKVKKGEKLGLNFQVWKNGSEFDGINELSGGEKDLISLALIISINKLTGSSILLLDECIASLNGEIRENFFKCVRELLSDKIVICISHEDVEGLYDKVIHLRKTR
jgi:exonuclease SbcC